MEVRKAQLSSGTLFVSLPKAWVVRHGLGKGSPIFMEEREDGALVLYPFGKVKYTPKSTVVLVSPDMEKEITSKYWLGYDSIVIRSPTGKISLAERERIKNLVRRFIGLEIVEENASSIELHCFIEASSVPPKKILRREHLLTAAMLRDLKEASLGDEMLLKSIVARDDEVDKLYFLLVRVLRIAIQNPVLSSELKVSPLDCMDYRLVACFIESIADSVASMADSLLRHVDSPKIYLERFRSLLTILSEIYEKAMEAFLAKDFKRAELARARREVFDSRLSSEDLGDIGFLSSELVRIADIAVDIADLVIP
ncbi:hypothetical protein DRO57_00835 [Candidatus Bathyarchaeota archaeon]|nr:MAG: hypothetical protein DRO57_00835 [Candidatus Bathyarchaeota archaeon]